MRSIAPLGLGVNGYLALFCQAVIVTVIGLKWNTLGWECAFLCQSSRCFILRYCTPWIGIYGNWYFEKDAISMLGWLDTAVWVLLTVYVALAGPSRPQRPENSLAIETSTLK